MLKPNEVRSSCFFLCLSKLRFSNLERAEILWILRLSSGVVNYAVLALRHSAINWVSHRSLRLASVDVVWYNSFTSIFLWPGSWSCEYHIGNARRELDLVVAPVMYFCSISTDLSIVDCVELLKCFILPWLDREHARVFIDMRLMIGQINARIPFIVAQCFELLDDFTLVFWAPHLLLVYFDTFLLLKEYVLKFLD